MERTRELLAGRYELGDLIGRGGMGVVYRATDKLLGRVVAVKLLPDDRAEDPMFVTRFEREALSAAALNHPNIVSVFDTGRDGGTHFIVMEYVEGANLATLVRRRGRLPPAEAADIAAQVASAIAAAHRAGIVHRDIKPANLMLDSHGTVKVLDFGIARASAGTTLTQPALVLGSAPYLAPEVVRGERADERSDIYSLGCVIYELVAGEPPFTGENPASILHQHNARQPRPLADIDPAVPAAFDRLVMRMLAKDPDERPQRRRSADRGHPRRRPRRRHRADGDHARRVRGGTHRYRRLPAASTVSSRRAGRPRGRHRAGARRACSDAAGLLQTATPQDGGGLQGWPAPGGRRPPDGHDDNTTDRHQRRSTTVATTTATPPTTTTSQTATVKHASAQPPTVAQTSGALTSLVTQDLQSGQIDQQAAQALTGQLQGILNAYDNANTIDALNHLSNLTAQDQQLVSHGDIQPGAEPAISAAVDSLGTALRARGIDYHEPRSDEHTGATGKIAPGAVQEATTPWRSRAGR